MIDYDNELTMKDVENILQDDRYRVRPENEQVPKLLQGLFIGDIFAKFARMNDGDDHQCLKSALVKTLMSFDANMIRQSVKRVIEDTQLNVNCAEALSEAICAIPILVMASNIGIKAEEQQLIMHIKAFVMAIVSPQSTEIVKKANESAQWLYAHIDSANGALKVKFVESCHAENINDVQVINANLLGIFFQTMDGMSGLIGQMLIQSTISPQESIEQWQIDVLEKSPPICNTRRFKNNAMILLPLMDGDHALPFGIGKHCCPGSKWASIIADEMVRFLYGLPVKPEWLMYYCWKASPNALVPEFLTKRED